MSNCENGMEISEVTLHLMTSNKHNYCGYFARQSINCISDDQFPKNKSKRDIHQPQSEDRHVEILQTSWHHDLNVRSRWFKCFSPNTTGTLSPRILSSTVSLLQAYCGSFLSLTCPKTGCSLLSLTCRKTCCRSWTFSFLLERNCLRM